MGSAFATWRMRKMYSRPAIHTGPRSLRPAKYSTCKWWAAKLRTCPCGILGLSSPICGSTPQIRLFRLDWSCDKTKPY
eukprot:8938778-Pyramimonas_sp.AAC.1